MVYRLETERLRLREWLPEDREPLAAMNADRRVMEFFPHPLSRAESDAFFDRIVAEWAESGRGLYAVERRGDGRLIGLTGLHRAAFEASFTPCIEIGWRFVAEVWGQGYATEAARAVLHDAFGRLGLPRVYSFTAAVNLRSERGCATSADSIIRPCPSGISCGGMCSMRLHGILSRDDFPLDLKTATIMEYITPFLYLLNTMAPYLLLGFLLAGVIHAYVPRRLYARYLSQPDFRSVALAALFGVPLPLCSCGVIPTAMSLRREGASKGAVTSFLIATPQTGVDSIVATYSVLGLPFAVIRPVVALVTALAGGWTVNRLTRSETDGILPAAEGGEVRRSGSRFVEALRYGFVDMIQDIGRWLVLGLLVAGLITILVPDNFFASFADKPLLNMAVVLLFSIPMYLCATGSIPIAAALMLKGLSPGAALVLLMAGPATNTASILVIGKVLGRRTLAAYLGAIVAGAVGFGLAIDYLLPAAWFVPSGAVHAACHGEAGYSWVEVASSALLAALLAYALMKRFIHRKNDTSMTKQIYRVGGMSCNHCKASVEKNLALLPSVTAVEVDLTAGTVAVEGTADAAEIRKVIEELGFEYKGRA